jgi:Ca2+-binding RTX toxin-like protein
MMSYIPFLRMILPKYGRNGRRRLRNATRTAGVRRARRRPLALEHLEERTLLSVVVIDQEALVVAINGSDAVTIGCTGTTASSLVKITANGAATTYTTLCAAVSSVSVVAQGNFANTINLAAVAAPFVGLNGAITVEGGAGDDSITGGAFAELLSGGAGNDVIVGGAGDDTINGGEGADNIAGGTGNDQIDGGSSENAVTGDAGSDTLVMAAGSAATYRIQKVAGKLQLSIAGNRVFDGDSSTIETVSVTGSTGDDLLVIDNSGGAFNGTIRFDGVSGGGSLEIIGGQTGNYQPSTTTPGDGAVVVFDGVVTENIEFKNLSPLTVHEFTSFSFTTSGSNDVIAISSPAAGQNKIVGSSGGIAFESLTFFDVRTFTIQAGAKDVAGTGQDSISVDSSGLVASQLQSFTVNTGIDDDIFSINSADYRLPFGGGAIAFNGGGGSNTFNATADVDFVLTDSLASITVGGANRGSVALNSVQAANLTGGASDNVFDVTGWTRVARLDGSGGDHDSVVSVNDSDFVLSDSALTRTTGGAFTLVSIEVADLTGGPGPNSFSVSNWSGDATLDGAGGSDVYTVNLTTNDSGNTTIADSGTTGADSVTLNGTAAADSIIMTATQLARGNQAVDFTGAENLTVNTLQGGDTINVRGAAIPTTVNAGTGDDTFNVGSLEPAAGGVLDDISASLVLNGEGGTNSLNLDDSGDASNNSGTFTSSSVTGLDMAVGISYTMISFATIALGSGDDQLTIVNTPTGGITVSGGAGADTITVENFSAPAIVNGDSGADTINIRTANGPVTVNGGAGDDAINFGSLAPASGGTLAGITGPVTVSGGGDSDSLTLDDVGSTSAHTLLVTPMTVSGLIPTDVSYDTLESLTIAVGSAGDTINVQGTSAATTISSGAGVDAFNVASDAPANTGNLDAVNGALTLEAGPGANTLAVCDKTDTAGNGNVIIGAARIENLAGSNDDVPINYAATGGTFSSLTVTTADAADVAETIHVHTPNGPLTLNANGGPDTINVRGLGFAATINAGAGTDTFNVGSLAPALGGDLNSIAALLTIHGDSDSDTLNVDDSGDGAANTGTLTDTNIVGLGTAAGINYDTLEQLNIWLGSGGDMFTIETTIGGATTLSVGGGGDTVNVKTTAGPVTVNGGAGADTINVGSLAPATGGNVSSIHADLTVNGDGDFDTLNLDDTGDATANSGTLTSTALTGLGLATVINYSTLESLNIALGAGGNTFTIASTHTGSTTLSSGDGATNPDTINVQTTAGTTTVNAQAGADTINVGSLTPAPNGTIADIDGVLVVNGGDGADVLNIDDTGNSADTVGTLRATSLTGLGMDGGITYGTIEALNMSLGDGGDTLTIVSTHAGTTDISTNGGDDSATIQSSGGPVTLFGGSGDDTFVGGPGDDVLSGGDDDDNLSGGLGNDVLHGGPGNDVLADGAGDDDLDGDSGDDTYVLTPGSSDNVTDSGGNDTLDFSGAVSPIRIDMDSSEAQEVFGFGTGHTVRLVGQIESFVGSRFNDLIFADPLSAPRHIDGGPHADVPPGDTLNFDRAHGPVGVTPTELVVEGFATATYEDIETLITTGFQRHIDFDRQVSALSITPTADGYERVIQNDVYDPERGFGWHPDARPSGFDDRRCTRVCRSPSLLRDGNSGRDPGTFLVDVTPETGYLVNVVMGDGLYSHEHMSVRVDGATVLPDLTNPRGQFLTRTFLVSPAQLSPGGQLVLQFRDDAGPDPFWVVNALNIRAAEDVGRIVLTPDRTELISDGLSQAVISGRTVPKLAAGKLVTVSSSLGTIIGRDVDPLYAGTQVAVDSDGRFQITLRAPANAGTASIQAAEVTGLGIGTTSLPVRFATVRQFDFDTPISPTAVGYIGVQRATYSPNVGYGWQSLTGLSAVDRRVPNDLDRDFHMGRSGIFLIDTPLTPNEYTVTLRVGDSRAHDNIDVLAEGSRVLHIDTVPAGTFREFTFQSVVSDGQLAIEFRDLGGTDRNFVINSLTLRAGRVQSHTAIRQAGVNSSTLRGVVATAAESIVATRTNPTNSRIVAQLPPARLPATVVDDLLDSGEIYGTVPRLGGQGRGDRIFKPREP